MRSIEISDAAFKKLEELSRARQLTLSEALTHAIEQAVEVMRLEQAIERRSAAARRLSGEDADRLATEVVREARQESKS